MFFAKKSPAVRVSFVIFALFLMPAANLAAQDENPTEKLTAEHGQVWRTYDISRYTARIQNTRRPELPVMDWILMETGFETWHAEIPAMLTVTGTDVRVFHTLEVQQKVAGIVSRFTNIAPDEHLFQVRIFTVTSPLWRQKITGELTPVPSFAVGSQAWTVAPEDLKNVVSMFESQAGYMLHSSQATRIVNGQPHVVSLGRPRTYTRNYYARPGGTQGPEAENITLEDGFIFEIMPLLTVDGAMVDAQLKCQIDHLDRFISMNITPAGGVERRDDQKIAVPMVGQYRFRERYQWNSERALLVSLGLTPMPVPTGTESRAGLGIVNPVQRVEMLVMVEYRNRK